MKSPNPADWVALFGGTFDPPHLGHREAVRGLFEVPGVSRVKVLPSSLPPLKSSRATTEQRVEMARLGFASRSGDPMPDAIEIDLCEITRALRDPARPSYSFDTLQELSREIPAERLAFVVGTDQLTQLDRWYRFPELLGLCHWIVLDRAGTKNDPREKLRSWAASVLVRTVSGSDSHWRTAANREIRVVPTRARGISSTEIRENLARTGQVPENTLVPEVESYLKTHRIYAISPTEVQGKHHS